MQNLSHCFPPTGVQESMRSQMLISVVLEEQIALSHLERCDLGQLHDLYDLISRPCQTGRVITEPTSQGYREDYMT